MLNINQTTSPSGETKILFIPFGPSDVQTILDIYLAAVMLALDKTIYHEKIKRRVIRISRMMH